MFERRVELQTYQPVLLGFTLGSYSKKHKYYVIGFTDAENVYLFPMARQCLRIDSYVFCILLINRSSEVMLCELIYQTYCIMFFCLWVEYMFLTIVPFRCKLSFPKSFRYPGRTKIYNSALDGNIIQIGVNCDGVTHKKSI